jgi:hypothetical protein
VDPLYQLIAIEEVKALKARYFRYLDTKDWASFAEVFSADATLDVSAEMKARPGDDRIIRGRHEIATFVSSAVADVQTVHHGHMPEIDVGAPEWATGTWAMEDVLRWPDGAPIRGLHGYGHYHETYEKHGDRWLIASTKLTRLRVDVEMADVA